MILRYIFIIQFYRVCCISPHYPPLSCLPLHFLFCYLSQFMLLFRNCLPLPLFLFTFISLIVHLSLYTSVGLHVVPFFYTSFLPYSSSCSTSSLPQLQSLQSLHLACSPISNLPISIPGWHRTLGEESANRE